MRRILAAMTGSDPDPSTSRAAMVERQLRARGIADERVLEAMGTVPREAFVPEGWRRDAYADEALPIDAGQTISQPVIVARMTELLQIATGRPDPRDRHGLRVPGGDPCLARGRRDIARASARPRRRRRVSAWPISGSTERVTIREADGSLGDPAGAPWDGIIVTAAAPAIPMPLRDQLADGARLVIPVGPRDQQFLTVVERHGYEWTEWTDGACVFVPLIGLGGFEARRATDRPWRDGCSRPSRRTADPAFRGRRPADPRRLAGRPGSRYTRPAMTHVFVAPHPGRRRPLLRRTHREPARARPDRDDPDGLLGRRQDGRLTAYQREALGFGSKAHVAGDRGVQPERHRRRLADRRARARRGPRPRTGSKRPRPTRTPRASASGSARRGIAGRASATNRSPSRP